MAATVPPGMWPHPDSFHGNYPWTHFPACNGRRGSSPDHILDVMVWLVRSSQDGCMSWNLRWWWPASPFQGLALCPWYRCFGYRVMPVWSLLQSKQRDPALFRHIRLCIPEAYRSQQSISITRLPFGRVILAGFDLKGSLHAIVSNGNRLYMARLSLRECVLRWYPNESANIRWMP